MATTSHFNMTAIRATFSDVRLIKGRKQAQLVFELPIEQADAAIAALGGLPRSDMERWCGICLLNSDPVTAAESGDADQSGIPRPPEPSQAAGEGRDTPRRRFHELSRREQAVLLCKDVRFQEWIGLKTSIGTQWAEDEAAGYVRNQCAVKSRADLDTHPGPAQAWDRLHAQYLADTGQAAEPR